MGKPTAAAADMAVQAQEASLGAVNAATPWAAFTGSFNFQLRGTFVGTVILEVSFDGGATAAPITREGGLISFTSVATERLENHEPGVLFRARMTAWTSGAALARLSQ
jgi:hypothetical protein